MSRWEGKTTLQLVLSGKEGRDRKLQSSCAIVDHLIFWCLSFLNCKRREIIPTWRDSESKKVLGTCRYLTNVCSHQHTDLYLRILF